MSFQPAPVPLSAIPWEGMFLARTLNAIAAEVAIRQNVAISKEECYNLLDRWHSSLDRHLWTSRNAEADHRIAVFTSQKSQQLDIIGLHERVVSVPVARLTFPCLPAAKLFI